MLNGIRHHLVLSSRSVLRAFCCVMQKIRTLVVDEKTIKLQIVGPVTHMSLWIPIFYLTIVKI